jgi:hypothetical protein
MIPYLVMVTSIEWKLAQMSARFGKSCSAGTWANVNSGKILVEDHFLIHNLMTYSSSVGRSGAGHIQRLISRSPIS